MRDVAITGIGLVTPLGATLQAFSNALMSGVSAVRPVESRYSGTLAGATVDENLDTHFTRQELSVTDRVARLAAVACDRALSDAGLTHARSESLASAGVFVGNGTGGSQSASRAYEEMFSSGRMQALSLLRCMHNSPASLISIRCGTHGPSHVYAAACASASVALGEAARAVRHGYLDVALVGGAEAPFGEGVLKAWDVLRVLTPPDSEDSARSCRPFARHRNGIVLGEGAVFFVLESGEHAASRGAQIRGYITGYGTASDGRHMVEPDAAGQVLAMKAALKDARIQPSDVVYINAHGTGTKLGDLVEASSIREVFGVGSSAPLVSSTKASHGHLLGASGAIELAACLATLEQGQAPPTLNLQDPDPECALNHVAEGPSRLAKPGSILSNSFAFGGTNACILISRTP